MFFDLVKTFAGIFLMTVYMMNSKVMENSAEKIRLAGNPNVMVCERGTMFGYSKLSSPVQILNAGIRI